MDLLRISAAIIRYKVSPCLWTLMIKQVRAPTQSQYIPLQLLTDV